MRRHRGPMLFVAAVALAAAAPALADHLKPSPSVRVDATVPPRPSVDFSPVPDPLGGAWRGLVSWSISCPGGDRFGYSIWFADMASGSHRLPPTFRRDRSLSVPWFEGSGYTTSPSGQREVTIPAGSAVFPHMEARCYVFGTNSHESDVAQVDGDAIFVPPYVWYPVVRPVSRQLSARSPIVLRRGRTVTASIRVSAKPQGAESVRLFVAGPGVKVDRAYRPSRPGGPISVRFRPTKRGVVRLWAVLQPHASRSNVIGLRVR